MIWHIPPFYHTPKEKRVLNSTLGALFWKTVYGKTVPFWKVAPKQCPERYHFTDDQTVPQGATYFFECRPI